MSPVNRRVRRTTTETIRVIGAALTAGDLRAFVEGLPDAAEVTVRTESPDRPGEMTVTTVTATVENGEAP